MLDQDATDLKNTLEITMIIMVIVFFILWLWPAEMITEEQNEILREKGRGNYVMNVEGQEDLARFVVISNKGKIVSDKILTSFTRIVRHPQTGKVIGGTFYHENTKCFQLVTTPSVLTTVQLFQNNNCNLNAHESNLGIVWQRI
ncbi:hypothetical protein ACFOEK_02180 [Litoribrevibacter euphylliae]|uniref:Uncharacterized protein n=1 Tax=Litoribrevibacter euphylliae TaxID=1834034 RepID=A0ABV7HAZ2_9GAMM